MLGSSINSWDSWFIFNLRKINTYYYMNTAHARKQTTTVGDNSMYILNNVCLECWFSMGVLCERKLSISLQNTSILISVHTWASVFLMHLASTSCMVPSWAYLDSGSVPIPGTRSRSHAPQEEIVYSLNDSCSHFTNVFSLHLSLASILSILLWYDNTYIHIVHYIYIHTSHIMLQSITQWEHVHLVSSFLPHYVAGWLLSIYCVRYS